MRVLVTGGAGFIGSHIVDALLERGHKVIIQDDMSSGRYENIHDDVSLFKQSVVQGIPIDSVGDWHFDAICHQAAQPSLRRSIDDPAHDAMINIVGTLNVIQAARACGAHVVFASTSAVYAPGRPQPYYEDSVQEPVVPYGIAKLTAERYLKTSGIPYTILRYGNVYGPRQVQVGENQLVPHCLAHLLDGKPFAIHGDGQQTRDFVYVKDIARANVMAIEERAQGVYNCGTGQSVSVGAVCAALAQYTEWLGGPSFVRDDAKPGEARHIALDSTKALNAFGWRAQTPLEQGLRETVGWWRERR